MKAELGGRRVLTPWFRSRWWDQTVGLARRNPAPPAQLPRALAHVPGLKPRSEPLTSQATPPFLFAYSFLRPHCLTLRASKLKKLVSFS